MNNSPDSEEWTDDRLLHEGVWLVEQQLEIDPTEVKAWAEFVRKVWAARDLDNPITTPVVIIYRPSFRRRVSAIAENVTRHAALLRKITSKKQ